MIQHVRRLAERLRAGLRGRQARIRRWLSGAGAIKPAYAPVKARPGR